MDTHIVEISGTNNFAVSGDWCKYISPIPKYPQSSKIGGSWCEYMSPLSIAEIYNHHKMHDKAGEAHKEVFSVISLDGRTVYSITKRNFTGC